MFQTHTHNIIKQNTVY